MYTTRYFRDLAIKTGIPAWVHRQALGKREIYRTPFEKWRYYIINKSPYSKDPMGFYLAHIKPLKDEPNQEVLKEYYLILKKLCRKNRRIINKKKPIEPKTVYKLYESKCINGKVVLPSLQPRVVEPYVFKYKYVKSIRVKRKPSRPQIYKVKDISCKFNPYYIAYLKRKIREKINNIRPSYYNYVKYKECIYNDVIHQMMMDEHGDTGGNEVKAGNVVIEQAADVVSSTQANSETDWVDFVSSDVIVQAKELTDRWIEIGDFNWTTNSSVDLYSIALPADIISNDASFKNRSCDTPNFTLFNLHAYSVVDMTVKLLVNSNKFQNGCIQMSWIYQDDCDNNIADRENIYTLSQTSHVRAYAGTMNECELNIPFMHSLSMLYNQKSDRVFNPLRLGKLFIKVVNPLRTGANVSTEVHCTLELKFNTARFTGMRAGNVPDVGVEMQMLPAAGVITTVAAMRLLDTYLPDPNRDNPPLNAEASFVVPTASHSWCAGTGRIDISKILRLDTRGQTHHPQGINLEDGFNVTSLKRKKGLIQQYTITKNVTARKDMIFSIPVEPMFGRNLGKRKLNYEISNAYYLPPISVLSSLFNYWRGEIDFEIDIVASQFHTFKLMFAYIPNAPAKGVTFEMAQKSPKVIVSCEGPKNITLRIPYVANQRWWPRTFTGNFSSVSAGAPSRLYCFLNNALLLMESASNTVFINVYASAAPSFEVAVPVQPSIGLGSNAYYFPSDEYVKLKVPQNFPGDYESWTVAVSHNIAYNHTGFLTFTCKLKKGHSITQEIFYEKRKEFEYNKDVDTKDVDRILHIVEFKDRYIDWSFKCTLVGGTSVNKDLVYGVLMTMVDKDYSLLIGCNNRKVAFMIADSIQSFNYDLITIDKTYKDTLFFGKVAIEKPGDLLFDAKWNSGNNPNPLLAVISSTYKKEIVDSDFDFVTLQNGEREELGCKVLSMGRSLKSTGYGRLDFGETFDDLYNLCRRPQLYGNIKLDKKVLTNSDKCAFIFSVNPQGLDKLSLRNSTDPSQVFNRCRDGPIPLLLSGYRYFRGSLRFRLVFPACDNALIWVQHRPDRPSRPQLLEACSSINTAQGIYNHGYASEIQLCNINSTVEFEVPFYQYDHYGLLQTPKAAGDAFDYQYGLGQICVGIKASDSDVEKFTDKYCDIYYSLADDFSPSIFYGFPPMLYLDDIPSTEHQMGLWSKAKDFIKSGMDEIKEDMKQNANEVADEILADKIRMAKECYEANMKDTADDLLTNSKNLMILNIITNIAHSLANFNARSIAISIVSIFLNLGLFTANKLEKIYNVVTSIVERIGATEQTGQNEHQGPMNPDDVEREEVASWVSLLFGGICSIFSVSLASSQPSGKKFETFLKHFSFGMRGSNGIFIFIKNSFLAIKKICKYLFFKCNPEYRNLKKVNTEKDTLNLWIKEALYLIDPVVYDKRYADQMYVDRVYAAIDYGSIFIVSFLECTVEQKYFNSLNKLYNKLLEIKSQLNAMGKDPHIRREPYGIYMYGLPGIGKSSLRETVCLELLKSVNYNFDSPDVFCVVNASAKHWDQCRKQPVLVLDDLWNIQAGEMLYEQISTIFQIFSSVVLCPPKAAVDDKNMRYNPRIVWMNSNYASLQVEGADMDAVNRRKNILIEAKSFFPTSDEDSIPLCPHCIYGKEYNGGRDDNVPYDFSVVPASFLKDFHHMRFYIHKDKIRQDPTYSLGPFTYNKMLHYLTTKFKEFDINETEKFNHRVQFYQRLIQNITDEDPDIVSGTEETFAEAYESKVHAIKVQNDIDFTMYKSSWKFKCEAKAEDIIHNIQLKIDSFKNKIFKYSPIEETVYEHQQRKRNKFNQYKEDEYKDIRIPNISEKKFFRKGYTIIDKPIKIHKESDEISYVLRDGEYVPSNNLAGHSSWAQAEIFNFSETPDEINIEFQMDMEEEDWRDLNKVAKLNGNRIYIQYQGVTFYSKHAYALYKKSQRALDRVDNREEIVPGIFLNDNKLETFEGEIIHDDSILHADEACYRVSFFDGVITRRKELDINKLMNDQMFEGYDTMTLLERFALISYAVDYYELVSFAGRTQFWVYMQQLNNNNLIQPMDFFFSFYCNVVKQNLSHWVRYNVKFKSVLEMLVSIEKQSGCPHIGLNPAKLVCVNNALVAESDPHSNLGVTCASLKCPLASKVYCHLFYRHWLKQNVIYLRAYNNKKLDMLPEYFRDDNPIRDEFLINIFDKVTYYWDSIWKNYFGKGVLILFNIIATLLPFLGMFIAIKRIYSYSVREADKLTEGLDWQDPQNIYNPADFHGPPMHKGPSGHAVFQGSQQAHHVMEKISRNLFYLVVLNKATMSERSFRCVGLFGKHALALKHYIECIDYLFESNPEQYELYFRYCNDKGQYIPEGQILLNYTNIRRSVKYANKKLDDDNVTNTNVCIFILPRIIQDFKNIIKFISFNKNIKYAGSDGYFADGTGKLINIPLTFKEIEITGTPTNDQKKLALNTPAIDKNDTKANATRLYSWWEYGLQQQGFCGSLILATNLEKPIVGIHVAGSPKLNYGFAEPLYYEMFEKLPHNLPVYKQVVVPKLNPIADSDIELQGPLVINGYVDEDMRQNIPRKSKITPSKLHGYFPIETAPNPLDKGPPLPEGCDPMSEGVNKHGHFVEDFDKYLLERAYEDLKWKLLCKVKPLTAKVEVLDDNTAVCGHPDIHEFDSLAWDTSAGYPLSKHKPPGEKGKKWLFNLDIGPSGYTLIDYAPELSKILYQDREHRSEGVKPFTVFTDCLKDTCIPIYKCSIPGKTRIFSVSPVQYTIEYKRYFMHFMGAYRHHRIYSEHAIGINCDSLEWTQLVRYLGEVGSNYIVGDYSNFGPGLNLEVAHKAAEIMVDWNEFHGFSPDELSVCRILNDELLNRYHLCDNIVYRPPAGSPSGGPSTDIINSLVNCLYIRMAWLSIVDKDFSIFDANVRLVVYGDDIIMCVSNNFIDIFNGVTLSKFFEKYRIKFTDALKTGEIVPFRYLDSCDFLKRKFKYHPKFPGVFLAPIALESIHSCLNWIKGGLQEPIATEENVRAALDLLYGQGPDIYKEYALKIADLCIKLNIKVSIKHWEELDNRNFIEAYHLPVQPFHDNHARWSLWRDAPSSCKTKYILEQVNHNLASLVKNVKD